MRHASCLWGNSARAKKKKLRFPTRWGPIRTLSHFNTKIEKKNLSSAVKYNNRPWSHGHTNRSLRSRLGVVVACVKTWIRACCRFKNQWTTNNKFLTFVLAFGKVIANSQYCPLRYLTTSIDNCGWLVTITWISRALTRLIRAEALNPRERLGLIRKSYPSSVNSSFLLH